jgi:dynein heavy chain
MDLVLFEDAMKHVCKISRIIANSQGHALLVGVGGSGKQSLTRLATFINGYSTVGIVISSSYGLAELKTDLQGFFMKSGVKDEGLCFLFTEGQITNERFLVYLNDLLSSGEIADLF